MAAEPTPKAAIASPLGNVEADDPMAPHDLNVTLRCASEAAAYDILMQFASKMHLQCHGLDDLPEGRSLPEAGTNIRLLTRGPAPQELGHGVVSQTNP